MQAIKQTNTARPRCREVKNNGVDFTLSSTFQDISINAIMSETISQQKFVARATLLIVAPTMLSEIHFGTTLKHVSRKKSNDFGCVFTNCQQKWVSRATRLTMPPKTPSEVYFSSTSKHVSLEKTTISEEISQTANRNSFAAQRGWRWRQRRLLNLILRLLSSTFPDQKKNKRFRKQKLPTEISSPRDAVDDSANDASWTLF